MRIEKSNLMLVEQNRVSLVKESEVEYGSINKFKSPKDVVQVVNEVFDLNKMAEEYVFLLCLTVDGDPISFFEISHGIYNSAPVNGREIMIRALLCGAANIILIHNHPSGNPKPSKEDFQVTDKMKEICKLIGIEFTDHIIVAGTKYYSFKEHEVHF